MTQQLRERLRGLFGCEVASIDAVGGGCIAAAYKVLFGDGAKFFVKLMPDGQSCLQEANGLRELAKADALPIPEVRLTDGDLLALSWVEQGPKADDFSLRLGRGLAMLHSHRTSRGYGFFEDNWIGATPQRNETQPNETWSAFFWRQRLLFQWELAVRHGLASAALGRGMEALERRISSILPEAPTPVVLHGDLWSGNALADADGAPWLIDPAVYYGHAEADLGMAEWFGHFGPSFWRGYGEVSPLAPGYEERIAIYKLYHVLNHVNLFGRGYVAEAVSLLRGFC